jgi:hypothetical protein
MVVSLAVLVRDISLCAVSIVERVMRAESSFGKRGTPISVFQLCWRRVGAPDAVR